MLENLRSNLQIVSWDDVPYPAQTGMTPYRVIDDTGSDTGLFTGYFEPTLHGSFTKTSRYCHPVYAPPPRLRVSRGEVMRGALERQNLELLYVDDAVDLFFAHVQGSAAIQMEDGTLERIGFAARSGHPYVAIGKTLKDMGVLKPPITMQTIKVWLRAHRDQQEQVFASNPSYIFFTLRKKGAQGPLGAGGQTLIPLQSLAVDDTRWPYGLSVLVESAQPSGEPFLRLMRTADTGSAIRGVLRGDIYFGSGDSAGVLAGAMNAQGKMWALLSTTQCHSLMTESITWGQEIQE